MQPSNKKFIVTGVVVAAVVFVAAAVLLVKQSPNDYGPAGAGTTGKNVPPPAGPVTRESAPVNVIVPNKGDKDVPANVAVPNIVSPGSSSGSTSYRSFSIKVANGQFVPNTVDVHKGDTIDLNFTAVDRDYDFTQPDFGFKVPIPKGSNKRIQFGATVTGKFTFYCSSCGGPASGPLGYVIVVP